MCTYPQTIIAFFLGLYTQNDLADVHGNIIAELWPPPALTISAHAVYIYRAASFPCQFIYFGSSMKHGETCNRSYLHVYRLMHFSKIYPKYMCTVSDFGRGLS